MNGFASRAPPIRLAPNTPERPRSPLRVTRGCSLNEHPASCSASGSENRLPLGPDVGQLGLGTKGAPEKLRPVIGFSGTETVQALHPIGTSAP
jgi:hypothetical protein